MPPNESITDETLLFKNTLSKTPTDKIPDKTLDKISSHNTASHQILCALSAGSTCILLSAFFISMVFLVIKEDINIRKVKACAVIFLTLAVISIIIGNNFKDNNSKESTEKRDEPYNSSSNTISNVLRNTTSLMSGCLSILHTIDTI